jgi:hypothetical protein
MKFRSVFVATLGFGMAALSLADDAANDLRAFLNRFEPQVVKAFAKKDIKFFERISTSDFKYVDSNKVAQEKKAALEGMKQFFAMSSAIHVKFNRGKIAAKGNSGSVDYHSIFTSDVKGPDGKNHKMRMETWTTETYRKVKSAWLVAKIQETKPAKISMDGKPFDPSKMAPPPPRR